MLGPLIAKTEVIKVQKMHTFHYSIGTDEKRIRKGITPITISVVYTQVQTNTVSVACIHTDTHAAFHHQYHCANRYVVSDELLMTQDPFCLCGRVCVCVYVRQLALHTPFLLSRVNKINNIKLLSRQLLACKITASM